MPKALSSNQITQIVRLKALNLSVRKKAAIVGVTHPSISFYEQRMDELGVSVSFVESLSDDDKLALFHPKLPNRTSSKAPINYEEHYKDINAPQPNKGKYLLKHAHEDHVKKYGKRAHSKSSFYRKMRRYAQKQSRKESLPHDYQPGEVFFCDYVGPTLVYGENDEFKANFIAGCFGHSGYLVYRATDTQKASEWMAFIRDTFHQHNRKTYRIVHDNGPLVASAKPNLKFNKMYQGMIDHYHLVVNPTPRRSPNFNALAETAVKIFEIDILPRMRRRHFKSLKEINDFIQTCLVKINQRILSGDIDSREDKFIRDELPAMTVLTESFYEIPEYTRVFNVPRTWCFKVDGVKYTIPYAESVKRVTVLIRKQEIEIKGNGRTLCVHERLRSGQKLKVNPKHLSKKFEKYYSEDQAYFENWAKALSPSVLNIVEAQFNGISTPDFDGRAACIQLQKLAKKTTEANFIACCDYVESHGELTLGELKKAIENDLANPNLDQLCLLLGAQFNQQNGGNHVH